jgi:hypothetical protein
MTLHDELVACYEALLLTAFRSKGIPRAPLFTSQPKELNS